MKSTANELDISTAIDQLLVWYLDKSHLIAIFDEKYMQFVLYEMLHRVYGDKLKYEYKFGELGARNEVDLAVPGDLAIELKWLREDRPGRASSRHGEHIHRLIHSICRLVKLHQRGLARTSLLFVGGVNRSWCDFYETLGQRGKSKYDDIISHFLPYDQSASHELNLALWLESRCEEHRIVFEKLRKKLSGWNLPKTACVSVHAVGEMERDLPNFDYWFVELKILSVSSDEFSIA
jgi:hypothetical protein